MAALTSISATKARPGILVDEKATYGILGNSVASPHCAGSPLPVGRVDFSPAVSDYIVS
jgi:hypothetical protein